MISFINTLVVKEICVRLFSMLFELDLTVLLLPKRCAVSQASIRRIFNEERKCTNSLQPIIKL